MKPQWVSAMVITSRVGGGAWIRPVKTATVESVHEAYPYGCANVPHRPARRGVRPADVRDPTPARAGAGARGAAATRPVPRRTDPTADVSLRARRCGSVRR